MKEKALIFEVNEKSFPDVVVQNSFQVPVIVEFLAVSSEPCFVLDGMFSGLAREFPGQFIFAKVDIDEQQALRKQYKVNNIPTIQVFKNGEVIRTEEGQLQEIEARAVLNEVGIYHESDVMRVQAREKHMAGDTSGAILLLTQAIKEHPGNIRVAMDMVQVFIDIGDYENARGLFDKLPEANKNDDTGKMLSGQLNILKLAGKTEGIDALRTRIENDDKDFDAWFDLAICLVAKNLYDEAFESLFKIQTEFPAYKEGAARELIIMLIKAITPANPQLAQSYQTRLGNLMNQ